jgi:type IV pilus assembly protein PilV
MGEECDLLDHPHRRNVWLTSCRHRGISLVAVRVELSLAGLPIMLLLPTFAALPINPGRQRAAGTMAGTSRRAQVGALLLEALVAILIFSLGVLGFVGLQAKSIRYVSDAQYRAEAAFMVSSYLSRMRTADYRHLAANYGDPTVATSPAEDFQKNAVRKLPGASNIAGNPGITITAGPGVVGGVTLSAQSSLAVVTVWWLLPGEDAAAVDPVDKKGHKFIGSGIVGSK